VVGVGSSSGGRHIVYTCNHCVPLIHIYIWYTYNEITFMQHARDAYNYIYIIQYNSCGLTCD